MGLRMAKPFKRKGSDNYWFRRGTPRDILEARKALAAHGIKVAREVTSTLGTADKSEAKRRCSELNAKWEAEWQQWRKLLTDGPRILTQKEIFAVISEMARDVRNKADANPGNPELWKEARETTSAFARAPEAFQFSDEIFNHYRAKLEVHLAKRYGWPVVARESLEALLRQFLNDMPKIADAVGAMASGDYGEPAWLQGRPQGGRALIGNQPSALTFTLLLERWAKLRGPSACRAWLCLTIRPSCMGSATTPRRIFIDALIDSDNAHRSMSTQALNSEKVQEALLDTLLGPARLYDALRALREIKQNETGPAQPET